MPSARQTMDRFMSNTIRHSSGQAARIRTATTSGGAPVSTDVVSGVAKCRFSARTCAEASSSKHTHTGYTAIGCRDMKGEVSLSVGRVHFGNCLWQLFNYSWKVLPASQTQGCAVEIKPFVPIGVRFDQSA